MPRVIRTLQADEDLLDIWLYVAQDNVENADRLLSKIYNKCEILATASESGRRRDELATGLRSLVEGSYVIFYRINQDNVEIIRILHGARNLDSIFN